MHRKSTGHLIGHIIYISLYVMLITSTIILYNSASLVELLYIGWVTLVLGIVFLLWSSQSRKRGQVGEGINKEILVENGMYAFVRHPEFLGHMLTISALVILSQHWINLVIGAILIILLWFAVIEEEKRNIEKFGDAYRDYMKRVPRMNLIAGIIKQLHSKRENKDG